jgi:hypothetical protein
VNGFGQRYVVDTNALTYLRRHRRASVYFRENAVIPSEVLHEAEGFPDINLLRKNLHPTTAQLLRWLIKVMETVPDYDRALVDLYANHGGADPVVVACALDCQASDSLFLDSPDWIVVTGDDAVREKAEEFGLRVLSNGEFAEIIDAAENQNVD